MYIDESIIFGSVIILATCVFMGYWANFAYQHIKADEAKESKSVE